MPRGGGGGAVFIHHRSSAFSYILLPVGPADGVALLPPAGLHPLIFGDETVSAVAQQPPTLDTPAPPLTKPVSNLALTLIRQPVAQVILQLDSGVLVAAILDAHH